MSPKKEVNKKGYKKRPKNKNEIDSFSGVIKKKKAPPVQKKPKVTFEFQDEQGITYKTGEGRLKIDKDGGVSFLLSVEDTWKTLKGHIKNIKING